MKKVAAIGLLSLLLFNMFGVPIATLFFEHFYQTALPTQQNDELKVVKTYFPTLPYNTTWENQEGQEGLIREGNDFYNITHQKHENDTLYTILKTNQNARDRFLELSSMIQGMVEKESTLPETPLSKAVKLLTNLLKVYLPNNNVEYALELKTDKVSAPRYIHFLFSILTSEISLHSPPPERG